MLTAKKYLLTVVLSLLCAGIAPAAPAPAGSVLILYDASGPQGWIGALHARMLANLMGHFDLPCQLAPVENYQAGDLRPAKATFYFGLVYDNPIPAAFRADALAATNPVCWFKYNLWHLDQPALAAKSGFQFADLDATGYSNIAYQGETFLKNQLDPELGLVTIVNSNRASTPMRAWRTNAGNVAVSIPYVTQGSNFWYVADSPFDYAAEEDRYVPFADLLHDIVGNHSASHRAVIRIEDVSPEIYSAAAIRQVADLLHSNNVPFALALIPVYVDPLGAYNDGLPLTHYLSDTNDPVSVEFLAAIRHAVARGGQLIIHGLTHQYDALPNPFTATTGDDYEFWRVRFSTNGGPALYAPVPEDSPAWALDRINAAKAELSRAGLGWVAFEPPHYAASAADYPVIATNFSLTMQRVLYFDAAGHSAGQFFPYFINRDAYGQKVMPENLGNFAPNAWFNFSTRTVTDLLRTARKNLVVRDGWANAYYHSFFDLTNIHNLVTGIRALGYTYVPLSSNVPPSITAQPEPQSALVGASPTFSVSVVGTPPLAYQWRLDGVNLPGATAASLLRSNVQHTNVGGYSVVISNAFGVVTSYVAGLTVAGPPAITTPPQSRTNLLLTPATFSVTGIGSAPLAYQWQFNGTNLPGATAATLDLPAVQVTDAGNYTVIVSNSYGAVTSAVAVLTVNFLPSITTPPSDRTNYTGTTATFSVIADGTGPFRYQWLFAGVALPGRTNATLTMLNVPTNAAGPYSVVVTNAYGAVTSSAAVLTVLPALPPTLTAQPVGLSNSVGTTATFAVEATGSAPLRYQWRRNNVNLPGATNTTLSITNISTAQAGSYTVVVTNQFGAVISRAALLAVGLPPTLATQPVSRTNLAGTTATFTTAATGTAPLRYQWRFNDVPLPAAVSAALSLANVQSNHVGAYSLVVSNSFGTVTSAVASLTVNYPPRILTPPQSQTILLGTDATFTVVATGTEPLRYQWRFNNVNLPAATNATCTVTNLQAARVGQYTVVVANAFGSATSPYGLLVLGFPVTLTTSPVSRTNLAGATTPFSVTATGTAPLRYQWRFNDTDLPGATNATLSLANVQSNHAGNYLVVVTNRFNTVTSAVASLTVNVPAKILTPPQTQTVLVGADTTLSVTAIGTAPLRYQWRFGSANLVGATNATHTITNMQVPRAGYYSVVVANASGTATSPNAVLTLGFPVAITRSPLSRTNLSGTTAAFTVTATGTAPLRYQWRFNDAPLPGATNATLSLANVQTNHAGAYSVVVTNRFNTVTSDPATLTVNVAAKVITPPQTQTALAGTDVTFDVVAIGNDPLRYQWRLNNFNIAGATNATCTVTNLAPARAGNYSVAVANAYGTAFSANALLTLGFPVALTKSPVSRTNIAGTVASFTVTATGTAPLRYQWRFNDAPLPAATNATLNLANVQTNHAGDYHVVVTNRFNAVTSAVAALTVNVPAKIITPPPSQMVQIGTDVTLGVTALGTAPLRYQWRFGSANLVGATNATHTITNMQVPRTGYYSVVVANAYGTAVSGNALLTLGFPVTFTTTPLSRTNLAGTTATFSAAATGTAPLRYQWRFNDVPLPGAISSTLSLPNVQSNHSGNYTVVVSNIFGAVTSAVAALTVNVPAKILIPPAPQTVLIGSNATFNVLATGTDPLHYQWRFNNVNLPGETNATLTIINLQAPRAGFYSVVVTNAFGTATSPNALLTMSLPPVTTFAP